MKTTRKCSILILAIILLLTPMLQSCGIVIRKIQSENNEETSGLIDGFLSGFRKDYSGQVEISVGEFKAYSEYDTELAVTVKNNSEKILDISFTVEAIAEGQERVARDYGYSYSLKPGYSEVIECYVFVADEDLEKIKSAKFEISEISAYERLKEDELEAILDDKIDIEIGEYSVATGEYYSESSFLPVTVRNKSSENVSFSIEIEAIGEGNVRLKTDSDIISDLKPGYSEKINFFEDYLGNDETLKNARFEISAIRLYN